MANIFINLARRPSGRARMCAIMAAAGLLGTAELARAQEQILFPAIHNVQQVMLQRIRAETVRIDVAIWLLGDREINHALVARHRAGVPVRVIGDRVGIFESDPHTRAEFEYLAQNGIPIRLRYHPTWFPEIMHWKAMIFVGQNLVEFGSANFTTFELLPWSPSNFKDETAMFTDDPAIVRAFLTRFDQMWADTANFLDWPAVYQRETGVAWPIAMSINRARLEPDYPVDVPGMVWSQGPELLNAMLAEINRETQFIDLVSYRLTVPSITDALIRKFQSGVPVRVFVEPTQYRNRGFPEYWLVGAMADRLWAAGVPMRERVHQGLTHMKALVTSNVAMNGSANFTAFWQRDHNYFIPAATKPALHFAFRDRINAMWTDDVNYRPFTPQRPEEPALVSPGSGATVGTQPTLQWRRAPWAVAFDVYLGTSPAALVLAGRVNAAVNEHPPETYSFTPSVPLQGSTQYYWQVVSRTYASDRNPSLVAASLLSTFVTGAGGSSAPPSGCLSPSPGPGWTCVSGGWQAPASPPAPPPPAPPSAAPTPPAPAPAPASSTCTTIRPAADWVCVNGGWLPPSLAAAAAPAPAAPSAPSTPAPAPSTATCSTIRPAADWVCVNGGWLPPSLAAGLVPASAPLAPVPAAPAASPATCAGVPDPFVAIGGGVCVNGGWVPRGHPSAR